MRKISLNELKEQYTKVYDFITCHDMTELAEQRYDLGDDEFVNVESYSTFKFEERKYESHRKYIDIQCVIAGRENIIVEPICNLKITDAYNEERDIAFYNNAVRGIDCYVEAGEMLLLMPQDGHMPCVSIDNTVRVKKAVFKLKV